MRKIIQIIPAEGWYAVLDISYTYPERSYHTYNNYPLACWALYDDGKIEGMFPEGCATDNEDFRYYQHESEKLSSSNAQ